MVAVKNISIPGFISGGEMVQLSADVTLATSDSLAQVSPKYRSSFRKIINVF